MMFGLKVGGIVGAIGVIASILAYLAGHSAGVDDENARWQQLRDKQVAAASKLLADNLQNVIDQERKIADLSAKLEADHAKATADLDAAGAKYNRLGAVFERTKARCGGSGGNDASANPSTADVNSDDDDPGRVVSGPADETLGDIARDADRMRLAFLTCQSYVRRVVPLVNADRGNDP